MNNFDWYKNKDMTESPYLFPQYLSYESYGKKHKKHKKKKWKKRQKQLMKKFYEHDEMIYELYVAQTKYPKVTWWQKAIQDSAPKLVEFSSELIRYANNKRSK